MKVQPGFKLSAAALFASFVVLAPARAATQQTPTQDTPAQDTPIVVQTPDTPIDIQAPTQNSPIGQTDTPVVQTPSNDAHEAQEKIQRAAEHAAHEAEEAQERAAKAAHEAEERALEDQADMDVTVVGCVIREREYRKIHHSGKGGAFGMGIGGGNEYILVGATRITDNWPLRVGPNCDPTVGGDAYELTGKGESSLLRPYLGHWVELTGKLKKAEITRETRGTAHPMPTGGKGPFWQDLKIFEINVYAVKDYEPPILVLIVPIIQKRAAVTETPQPEVAETPEPAPVATTGREVLPKTASTMPLVALLGAFFVAAAIAIRVLRGMAG
jgi:hypothetical protein